MLNIFYKATIETLVHLLYGFLLLLWVALATIGYCIAMTPVFGG